MSDSCCVTDIPLSSQENKTIKGILWAVFFINLGMFFLEFTSGILSRSSTLVADSLDMLADAFVYGISLYVLNQSHIIKARASLVKGILMLVLGLYVVTESVLKIVNPVVPTGQVISTIGLIALLANGISVLLLYKHKNNDLNLKSAWICSRNDATSNVVVIIAGFLVLLFNSMWPDIIVGLGMSYIVLKSSIDIIKEAKEQSHL